MALMALTVVPIDGDPIAVKITPKVIVAAERHFKKGMGELFSENNVTYEALAWCAWQGLMVQGSDVNASFDCWLDGIESISSDDTEPAAGKAGQ
jgi:hypothetical protein